MKMTIEFSGNLGRVRAKVVGVENPIGNFSLFDGVESRGGADEIDALDLLAQALYSRIKYYNPPTLQLSFPHQVPQLELA